MLISELLWQRGLTITFSKLTATGHLLYGRYLHTATLLSDGTVLIAGGEYAADVVEVYTPSTRRFTRTANQMTPRQGHTATLLTTGEVLLAGGSNRAPLNTGRDLQAWLVEGCPGTTVRSRRRPPSRSYRASGHRPNRLAQHSGESWRDPGNLLYGVLSGWGRSPRRSSSAVA